MRKGKMRIIYRSDKWFDTQAKTLETKILKAKGSSLTYTGIGRELARNAIIEIQGNMLVLDEEQYKKNKKAFIAMNLR